MPYISSEWGSPWNFNLEILNKRFPSLGEQIQETEPAQVFVRAASNGEAYAETSKILIHSRFDPSREAWLQAKLIPDSAPEAVVYGLGCGHLPRVLLQRPGIRKIKVYLLNLPLLRAILEQLPLEILGDERLELAVPEHEKPRPPFTIVPAEVLLAEAEYFPLRDRIFLQLRQAWLNSRWAEMQQQITHRIQAHSELYRDRATVADFIRDLKPLRRPAVIFGAGPSLDLVLPLLTGWQEHYFSIVLDAALVPVLQQGLKPDVVLSLDPAEKVLSYFPSEYLAQLPPATALVAYPAVHPDLLRRWPRRLYLAYQPGDEMRVPEFKAEAVLPTESSVLHPALELAIRLEVPNLALVGVDLGFPGDRTHASQSAAGNLLGSGKLNLLEVEANDGRRLTTRPDFVEHLRATEAFLAAHPELKAVNLSPNGALIKGCQVMGVEEYINAIISKE